MKEILLVTKAKIAKIVLAAITIISSVSILIIYPLPTLIFVVGTGIFLAGAVVTLGSDDYE